MREPLSNSSFGTLHPSPFFSFRPSPCPPLPTYSPIARGDCLHECVCTLVTLIFHAGPKFISCFTLTVVSSSSIGKTLSRFGNSCTSCTSLASLLVGDTVQLLADGVASSFTACFRPSRPMIHSSAFPLPFLRFLPLLSISTQGASVRSPAPAAISHGCLGENPLRASPIQPLYSLRTGVLYPVSSSSSSTRSVSNSLNTIILPVFSSSSQHYPVSERLGSSSSTLSLLFLPPPLPFLPNSVFGLSRRWAMVSISWKRIPLCGAGGDVSRITQPLPLAFTGGSPSRTGGVPHPPVPQP